MDNWINVDKELPTYKKPSLFTFCDDGKIHKDIWYNYIQQDWMQDGPMDSYGHYKGKVKLCMPIPQTPSEV